METMKLQKKVTASAMLDPKIVVPAIRAAFAKLDPRLMIKNPVMFVVEIVAALTTVIFLRDIVMGGANLGFTFQIILWLWFTVLFANFAEAVAEGRGKAQAESLKKTRTESKAKLLEGAERQKTPNEIALNILLGGLTIIFVFATVTIPSYAAYAGGSISVVVLVALFVDKTGTITLGNRQATAFRPVRGVSEHELADAAQLASLADETPEGRSIVVLAKEKDRKSV